MNPTRPIDALKRFWWDVLAFVIIGAVVGGLPAPESAADSVTRWTASHTLLVSCGFNSDLQAFNQLPLFATTGEVPKRSAEAIDFQGSDAALAAQITVNADQQTGALRITTTQNDAELAVTVADTFADELVTYLAERQDQLRLGRLAASLKSTDELQAQLNEAQNRALADPDDAIAAAEVDALSREYSVTFEQNNRLRSAAGGQLVLTTLQRAQPVAISEKGLTAPRSRLSRGLLGAIVGLALGAGLAVVLARTDRRIRTREQAESVLGVTAHAAIAAVAGHNPARLAVAPDRHDPLSDSYRKLRSIIAFVDAGNHRADQRGAVTLIVSPGPGDGKSSIAANLASAFAETGERIVAVNSDFRRPTLTRRLNVVHPEPIGLEIDEIEHAPLELVLTPVNDAGLAVLDLSPMRGHSPGDLARVTARILPRVAAINDHVVVDTSPIGATAEVLEFVPLADTSVLVVRLGHTSIQAARRTIETLNTLSSGNLLLVIIGGETDETSYYYNSSALPEEPEQAKRPQARKEPKVSHSRFGRKKAEQAPAPATISAPPPLAPPPPPPADFSEF